MNATPKFLDQYDGQSIDDLIALERTHRVDSLVMALESALEATSMRKRLSSEERVVLAVEALEREVNNGGYLQFFLNSSSEYAGEIEAALKAIDCPKQAALAQQALAALGLKGNPTAKTVESAASAADKALASALEALDRQYLSCKEPIADRLFAFVKQNRERFEIP